MATVIWRKANQSDVDQLVSIENQTLQHVGALPASSSPEQLRSKWEASMSNDESLALCGVVDGTCVGAIRYGKSGLIEGLSVVPDAQRLGVASTLISQAEVDLSRIGIDSPKAIVPSNSASGVAFFASRGYAPESQTTLSVGAFEVPSTVFRLSASA
jgi:ribosomal protein S18 acetylase RimI-like enzyme